MRFVSDGFVHMENVMASLASAVCVNRPCIVLSSLKTSPIAVLAAKVSLKRKVALFKLSFELRRLI